MANQKYKVAFFGAPGAGKTVFLGSYFNLVTNLGQGRPVSFKSAAAARATDRIIETLFKRQVPVQNKLNAGEVSYSVDSFNMDVQLFQTPGGTCGGSYEWEASPILTELESADGALFLISAEDLVKRPEKALQENRTFIKALSFLFESKGSKWGKEETPVVFLFTKGDAVPEATAEALAEKMTGLFAPELDEESPLADYLLKTPGAVKAYKVTAIGDWADFCTLPKEYKPQNVIKPMEELYKTMNEINKKKREVRSILIAIAALLVLTALGTWALDLRWWGRTKDEIAKLTAASQFDEALKIVNSYERGYIFPDPIPLVPSSLRGGADKERVRHGIYKAYEKAEFSALDPLLKGLDAGRMPDVKSETYLEAAGRVEKYLANPEFEKLNKANYEKVWSMAWYFEAGQALLGKTAPTLKEGGENGSEAFAFIERWLDYMPKLPEQWKKDGAGKAGELFASWADMLKPESAIEEIEAFIESSQKIASNPAADDELKKLALEKSSAWKELIAEKWNATAREWIAGAAALPAAEGIEKLAAYIKKEGLPAEVGKTLAEALESRYASMADEIVADGGADIASIKGTLAKFTEMPPAPKKALEDRIVAIAKGEAEKIAGEISGMESFKALVDRMGDLKLSWDDYPAGSGEIAAAFEKKLSDLISAEWHKTDESATALTEKGDYAGAKELYATSLETVSESIEKAGLGDMSAAALSEAKKLLAGKLENLKKAHLDSCKSDFEELKKIKDAAQIEPVIEKLSAFEALWPESDEGAEAAKAAAFLGAVREGAKAVITIVKGDFTAEDSFWGSPDIRVSILKDGKEVLRTKTVKGQAKPVFGEKYEFAWDVASTLTFTAVSEGGMLSSDKEVLKATADGAGIFGYEKYTGTIKSGSNSLEIKLEIDLPESPWK